MRNTLVKLSIYMAMPLAFLLFWQMMSTIIDNKIILPGISDVYILLKSPTQPMIGMGSLVDNLTISLIRVLTGYTAAFCLAIPLGMFMGYSKVIFSLFHYFLGLFRPIPPLAWVPLVLAWFGVSSLAMFSPFQSGQVYIYLRNIQISMVFIIFIGAFFPILLSTIYGVQNIRKTLIESARTLGGNEFKIFWKILIPASAPSIVNGMRIGLGVAWMCLVSAEMLPGSISGVGYLIIHAYTVARTDVVIAGMISIGVVGVMLDTIFKTIETRNFAWQSKYR
ncbi:ABC transporter permease [Desulfonatronovibrio hydrogenovorans]|uniref:ABC transporter permease n=1 Tax=Desulfonatronovibrio hydrogenovorans TaxID=53245 RepID=UPI00048A646C|nr:ABC transporter permease [Desulfonatronovibrio hydrogenovorans]